VLPSFEVECLEGQGEPGQACAIFIDDLALFGMPSAYEPGHCLSVCDGSFNLAEHLVKKQWGVAGPVLCSRFTRTLGGSCLMLKSPEALPGQVSTFSPQRPFLI
jgi:hypothetical protein